MKKSLIILLVLTLSASLALAANYSAVTGDNEVEELEQVKVKSTEQVAQETVYSLADIDRQVAEIQANIATYEQTIADWQARLALLAEMRIAIEKEAKKIKLKAKEVVE